MKYLSVCSGIEAATQAWQPLGWQAVAFSEIEPFPAAVLAHHYPTVPNLGDMTKITYNRETETLSNGTNDIICAGGIDLLVGGTPCQSFSLAGHREGLKGASGLAYHFVRLLREIGPRWFVWENVPGALSSISYGRRDFNFLLRQYAECGYDVEWRVLDGRYVRTPRFPRAIPQRRRRLFVVGHLAAARRNQAPVLFEQEGLCGCAEPKRIKGTQDAPGFKGCHAGAAYDISGVDFYNGQLTGQVFKTINSAASDKDHTGGIVYCFNTKTPDTGADFAPTLPASGYKEPHAVVLPSYAIRRITITEGERLFGFPDGYTCIPWRGKPADKCPDGPRFKAIGNSMQVNVMEWIGLKIMQAERRAGL